MWRVGKLLYRICDSDKVDGATWAGGDQVLEHCAELLLSGDVDDVLPAVAGESASGVSTAFIWG